ncbi:MAG: MerR family transcriptional regulator [Candidatus Dependentiae bacterium]|nr:MerR family transcriptional regulator [Candidatus Dependentiae bacterium]
MKIQRKKGYFSISAVAEMFSIHQQTIRLYEKEGLIVPKRSEGNTRLFSEDDISRLEEIIYLTHKLGINLAGVEMIFKLKKQIHKMQKDMNKAFEEAQHELDKEAETSKHAFKASAQQLMKLKQEKQIKSKPQPVSPVAEVKQEPETFDVDVDNWEVEYDE